MGVARPYSLRLAFNDTNLINSNNLCQAHLDLTVNNPVFEAYIANELSIGWKTNSNGAATSDASLILGSNSVLQVGEPGIPANLYIGVNSDNANGNAIGLFEALQGTVSLDLVNLIVGQGRFSTATGTLRGGGALADVREDTDRRGGVNEMRSEMARAGD